jgi:hypothetical protein
MATLIGFIVGYVLGTGAGDRGRAELEESLRAIQSSPEVRELAAGLLATARDMVGQGMRAAPRPSERPRLRVA